ncbi:hypothetical protein BVG16_27830 [Paenibacillus selenitireducens]|uniref:Membrane-anchored protein n=1 Tax=Paenibacillus selenitireducens TaxID=1324314 RepID=A0A1T2X1B7_9BACL|nr:hypothetical protein BVG16_27830 [Paenibacillus selenitireducens]
MNKIAQVTIIFWIMKIAATTLGETGGDLLAQTLNVGYGVSTLIFFGFFVVMLTAQLSIKRHIPIIYWGVILATSVAGTTMSDYMDRTLALGYTTGSLILVTILLAILAYWYFSGESLNVNDIRTRKVEVIYWIAILFSNTLGTALGDFLSDGTGSNLGYVGGAILIGSILGIIMLAYYFTKVSRVFLFWVAFVLTRPFGATFGDLLTKSHEKGGMQLGTKGSSIVLAAILVGFILYTSMNMKATDSGIEEAA